MFLAECFTFSFVSVLWDFKIGPECIFFILQKNAFFQNPDGLKSVTESHGKA